MSNITHRVPLSTQIGEHRSAVLAGMLALLATTAVVLVLVLAGGQTDSPDTVAAPASVSALRADGGPEETGVAAAVSPKTAPSRPDESAVAASIGSGSDIETAQYRPDESAVAAAISGR